MRKSERGIRNQDLTTTTTDTKFRIRTSAFRLMIPLDPTRQTGLLESEIND